MQFSKGKNPVPKGYILHDSIYVIICKEIRSVAAKGVGCIYIYRCSLRVYLCWWNRSVWNCDGGHMTPHIHKTAHKKVNVITTFRAHPKFGLDVQTDDSTCTYQEGLERFITYIFEVSRESREVLSRSFEMPWDNKENKPGILLETAHSPPQGIIRKE